MLRPSRSFKIHLVAFCPQLHCHCGIYRRVKFLETYMDISQTDAATTTTTTTTNNQIVLKVNSDCLKNPIMVDIYIMLYVIMIKIIKNFDTTLSYNYKDTKQMSLSHPIQNINYAFSKIIFNFFLFHILWIGPHALQARMKSSYVIICFVWTVIKTRRYGPMKDTYLLFNIFSHLYNYGRDKEVIWGLRSYVSTTARISFSSSVNSFFKRACAAIH